MKKEFFTKDKAEYIRATKDEKPAKYECMECGCIFYGKWHSKYSMDSVICPICDDETDHSMIKLVCIESDEKIRHIPSIRQLKKRSGLTNSELAKITGVPVRTIEGWSSGRTAPADYVANLIEYKLKNEGYIPLRFFVADMDSYSVLVVADRNENAVLLDERFFPCETLTAEAVSAVLEEAHSIAECKTLQEISDRTGAELKIQAMSTLSSEFKSLIEI